MLKEGTKVIEKISGVNGVVVDNDQNSKYNTGIIWENESDSVFWYTSIDIAEKIIVIG